MKSVFLLLNILVFLVGCQVSEKTSSGSLISGHVPSSNVFTFVTPTAKTYVTGETLSLTLTFPFDVTVTGTPRLTMTVGATTRYADYTSGTGTSTLTFDYTFLAADNDSDGVAISGLDLNGGTLTFDNNGVSTNCAVASVTARTLTTTKVDNSGPTVSAFSLTNLPGFYNKNDVLSFSLTYSEAVIVTGTPRISVAFSTGGSLYATYAGGTGSTTLSFTMTIDNTMADTDGYLATSPIDLNSGTIQDSVGNTASLDISGYTAAALVYSSTVDLDGRLPYVVSVTNPANGTYVAAQSLEFSVEFDRAVTASGSPYLALTIGSATRQATYVSGTGTTTLLFRYVTIPGDVDADGIAVATTITQNSGTISGSSAPTMSYFSNASNNTFTLSPTTGIIVNSVQPQAISFTRNIDSTSALWGTALDNVWNIGQDLLISVTFNTNMYVDQTSGTPRIPLTIGAATSYATYLSGGNGQTTLIFRYIVVEGVSDTDGTIVMGDIDLNGGSITDIANTNTLLPIPTPNITTTKIDGIRPTISSLAAPASGTYSTFVNMNFTMTWSEAVQYSSASSNLPLTIGATAVSAVYTSGSNSASIIYRPTLTGLTDIDGIAFSSSTLTGSATIKDQSGNAATVLTFTPPVTTAVLVDTTAPTITSVTPPSAGTYIAGNTLDFAVTFSETVYVSSSGGYPRMALVLDSSTRYATYLSGSGTSTINFRYTVVANDSDLTGITNPTVVSVTNAPTAYIRDIAQNGGTSTSFALTTSLTGVIVDALAPSVSSRTIPANGTYDSGDALNFVMTFNEIVNVTGTPRIQVAAQTGTLNFDYLSGSGTTALTFRYTVGSSDFDFDGLPTVVNTISLNGGTIKDVALNNATLTFTTANLSSVYLAYPNTVVWTTSTFTNRSPIAGLTLSSSGVATTQTIAGQIFRTFNGDDELNLSSSITGAEVVYLVFKTNSALSTMDLLLTDIALLDDGTAFDLTTLDASITLDGVTSSSGTIHDLNMAVSTTHVLEVTFVTPANYSAGAFINSTFLGAIAEVIVVTGPLSPAEKSQISTYLNTKY